MGGFVYLLNAASTEFYKIGLTKNIKRRIAGIQTGSPLKIQYVHSVYAADPEKVERALHDHFDACRHFLEWFCFEANEIKECITLMNLTHDDEAYQRSLNPDTHPVGKDSEMAKQVEFLDALFDRDPCKTLNSLIDIKTEDTRQSCRQPAVNLDGLPSELRAIAQFAAKRNDWLTARECVQNVRPLKGYSTDQVRQYFDDLAARGVGSLQGAGDRLQFRLTFEG